MNIIYQYIIVLQAVSKGTTRFSALHDISSFLDAMYVSSWMRVMETNSRRLSCSERKIFKVSIASGTSPPLSSTLVTCRVRLLPLFPRLRGQSILGS